MRTRSRRSAHVLTGLLVSLGLAMGILTLLVVLPHGGEPQRRAAATAVSAQPPPSPRLDGAGMADLMVLRQTTRATAARATAAVETCLRRHGAEPVARRARIVRNCAFRPLAGAGASQRTNTMILASLRDRLRPGPCLAMVNAYGTVVVAFSSSAEEVVRTTGEWAPTVAAAASTQRLGRWVVRYSDRADWSRACVRASPMRGLLHEAA